MERLAVMLWLCCAPYATADVLIAVQSSTTPALPTSTPSVTPPSNWNATADTVVSSGGNLQSAINAATPGDVIEVEAGTSWAGQIQVPESLQGDSNTWTIIRTANYANLPDPGNRLQQHHQCQGVKLDTILDKVSGNSK